MFLRWRHRKVTTRRVSRVYVWKDDVNEHRRKGEPWYSEKECESFTVAVVESRRVNGKPRIRVVRHLGSFDPTDPPQPSWWKTRNFMRRIRDLDIPLALKERFLKEIEARGVSFAWPTSLEPMTQEEWDRDQQAVEASMSGLGARIAELHQQIT